MADQRTQSTPATAGKPQSVEVTLFEMLETVPPPVKEYLLSDEIGASRVAAWDSAKLTEDERTTALYEELRVFFKEIPVTSFADSLYTALGWGDDQEDRLARLAADLMGKVMFPADAWVGDVDGALQDIGFDPATYLHMKIRLGTRTFAEAATAVLAQAKFADASGETAGRATKVLDSYLRGIRVENETLEALMKSKKVGGVGLSESEARAVLAEAKRVLENSILTDERPAAKAAPAQPAAATQSTGPKQWTKVAVQAAYQGTSEEQAALAAKRDALRAAGDKNVLARFADEVIAEDKEHSDALAVVAGALMMAEAGVLMKSAKEPRIRQAFRESLEFVGQDDAVALLDKDPESPELFGSYLLFLLKVKTNLSENDAARFALKIGNAFRKSGAKDVAVNAAFHPEKGEFVWETSA